MNHYIRRRRHTKRKDKRRAGLVALVASCLVAGTVTAAGYYGYIQSKEGPKTASVSQGDTDPVTIADLAGNPKETGAGEEGDTTQAAGETILESAALPSLPSAALPTLPGWGDSQIVKGIAGITDIFGEGGAKPGMKLPGTTSAADGERPADTPAATTEAGKGEAPSQTVQVAKETTKSSSTRAAEPPASTKASPNNEAEPETRAASTESDTKSAAAKPTETGTGAPANPTVPSTEPAREPSTAAATQAPTTAAPTQASTKAASTQAPTKEPATAAPTQAPATAAPTQPASEPAGGQAMTVSAKLQSMTLEQKVAQMFLVTPEELTGYSRVTSAEDNTLQALQRYPVGGLVYFSNNMVSQGQMAQMTAQVQQYAQQVEGIKLFLATDEEGGARSTIAGKSAMGIAPTTGMSAIGATHDSAQAYGIGSYIGQYMARMGLNLDLAPIADVLTNPANDVIKGRSFGEDASNVSDMTVQMMRGLESQGVNGVLKHFPGHGSTDGRRMNGFPYTEKTLDGLMQAELVPFKQAIDQGADFIMAGHIVAPAVTGDQTPCSLSRVLITDVLRGQLGYGGIVVTDALNTPAVQQNYGSGQACVMAIQAGADILLMPKNFHSAYATVLQAVKDGTISEARINESVERILKVKMAQGG